MRNHLSAGRAWEIILERVRARDDWTHDHRDLVINTQNCIITITISRRVRLALNPTTRPDTHPMIHDSSSLLGRGKHGHGRGTHVDLVPYACLHPMRSFLLSPEGSLLES